MKKPTIPTKATVSANRRDSKAFRNSVVFTGANHAELLRQRGIK